MAGSASWRARVFFRTVQWANPHVTFKLLVDGGMPTEELWTIEGNSVSARSRMSIDKSVISAGSKVQVSGSGPVAGTNVRLLMNHMLLRGGKEVVFLRGA